MPKALIVQLPTSIADEIAAAAQRSERSVAFLVLGAMKGAGSPGGAVPAGPRRALTLDTDEDDPKDLAARLKKLAGGQSLDDAIALAWAARRTQILAWVERIATVNEGERADDLDEGLKLARDPGTGPEQLLTLAKSAYPRVRALVVAHPKVPEAALELLRRDREKAVREALAERG